MYRRIWKNLIGYVMIKVNGRSLEKMVNLAVKSGIRLWNVERSGAQSITLCMSIGGFY